MEPLVERAPASQVARERTKVMLLQLGGQWSVQEGCTSLGVSRTRFQDLRRRMIDFAVLGLEERAAGRPACAEDPESGQVASLRQRVVELEHELVLVQTQLDLAQCGVGEAVAARLALKGAAR